MIYGMFEEQTKMHVADVSALLSLIQSETVLSIDKVSK